MARALYRPVRPDLAESEEPLWDEAKWASRLTVKEQMFIREYLTDLNATGAARRAHYQYPNGAAFNLHNKPHVREAMQEALDERARRLGVKADEVLAEIAGLAFSSLADALEWGEREGPDGRKERAVWLKPRSAAPEAVWRGIQELRAARGALHVRGPDKLAALGLLARHLGMMPLGRAAAKAAGAQDAETPEEDAVMGRSLEADLAGLSRDQRDRIRAILMENLEERRAAREAVLARG
jgi:phage terminase small subunit